VTYQLNVLAIAVMYGGPALLQYEKLLIQVIGAAFDAPSSKVNEAGSRVLSGLLGSLVLYYPIDQHR
jgi:proteasome activator subunit 4